MADVQIVAGGTSAAPLAYTVPGAQEIIVKALTATFDGSGAATSFVPAIEVVAPSGKTVGTYTAVGSVAAAGSADVSFGPFLVGAGTGIQFNTDNEGGWLDITANDTDPNNFSIHVKETAGAILEIESTAGGVVSLDAGGTNLSIGANPALYISAGGILQVWDSTVSTLYYEVAADGTSTVGASTEDLHLRGGDINTLSSTITIAGTSNVRLSPSSGNSQFYGDGGIWLWDARKQTSFGIQIILGTGSKFEIQDHNQNPIFRVNEDGSLQGKTGKALTFNL